MVYAVGDSTRKLNSEGYKWHCEASFLKVFSFIKAGGRSNDSMVHLAGNTAAQLLDRLRYI